MPKKRPIASHPFPNMPELPRLSNEELFDLVSRFRIAREVPEDVVPWRGGVQLDDFNRALPPSMPILHTSTNVPFDAVNDTSPPYMPPPLAPPLVQNEGTHKLKYKALCEQIGILSHGIDTCTDIAEYPKLMETRDALIAERFQLEDLESNDNEIPHPDVDNSMDGFFLLRK